MTSMLNKIMRPKSLVLGLFVSIGLLIIPAAVLATHDGTPLPIVPGFVVNEFAIDITDPTGITVDPAGNIYTLNRVGGFVTKFDPAGNVVATVELGGVDLNDIHYDAHTGKLFVGSWVTQTAGELFRFEMGGGGSKTLIATLAGISGLTGDALGNIYASHTDANIVTKITAGDVVTTYATGFDKPDGIAFAPDGKLYVGSRTGQIMVVPAGGGAAADFATLSPSIMRIRTDVAGNLYALNADLHTISKISPAGVVAHSARGSPAPTASSSMLMAICLSPTSPETSSIRCSLAAPVLEA